MLTLKLADRDREYASSGPSLDTPGLGSLLGSSHVLAETSSLRQRPVHPTLEPGLAGHPDSIWGTAPRFDHDETAPIGPVASHFDDLWPQNQSQSITHSATTLQLAPIRNPARRNPETSNAIDGLDLVTRILYGNIPRSVNGNTSMRKSYFKFTIGQCE